MNLEDVNILAKKILLGVIVYLIPVVIIGAGLWFTNHFLKGNEALNNKTIKVYKQ